MARNLLPQTIDRRRKHICLLKWCHEPVSETGFCSFRCASEALLGYGHPRMQRERRKLLDCAEVAWREAGIPMSQWPAWYFLADANLWPELGEVPQWP